jgi:ABC-2 type transport system ATP-binding protein
MCMCVERANVESMAQTADRLIVIGAGRLIADTTVEEFLQKAGPDSVRVRSPQAIRLREIVQAPAVSVTSDEAGVLEITGLTAEQIGAKAGANGIVLYELTPQHASLEEAFMDLTDEHAEFKAGGKPAAAPGKAAA